MRARFGKQSYFILCWPCRKRDKVHLSSCYYMGMMFSAHRELTDVTLHFRLHNLDRIYLLMCIDSKNPSCYAQKMGLQQWSRGTQQKRRHRHSLLMIFNTNYINFCLYNHRQRCKFNLLCDKLLRSHDWSCYYNTVALCLILDLYLILGLYLNIYVISNTMLFYKVRNPFLYSFKRYFFRKTYIRHQSGECSYSRRYEYYK